MTIIRSLQMRRQRRGVFAQQAFGRGDAGQLVGQLPGGKAGGHEPARSKARPRPARPDRPARRPPGSCSRADRAGRRRSRVPGVTIRVTSRRTRPLACFGSSTCSQTAARMPGGDQLAQVAFQLMVRKAGHRDGVLALLAAGQREVRARGRPSWRRRGTARRNRPCETAAAHRGTPAWPPRTASSSGWRRHATC